MDEYKQLFPYFEFSGDITYLDNANTSQILGSCLSSYVKFHYNYNYNVSRATYSGARQTQQLLEWAHQAAGIFLNAPAENIIFTTGATEGLNLIARSFCSMFRYANAKKKPVLLTTQLEHASAILPWMTFGKDLVEIKYIKLDEQYRLTMENLKAALEEHRPDVLLLASMTNTTGEFRPLKEMGTLAKQYGVTFVVDHAQGAAHAAVDVEEMNIDFLALSAHKMYGPKGVGILYARRPEFLQPIKVGGGMNKWFDTNGEFEFQDTTEKLIAGTQNIPGIYSIIEPIEFLIKNWQNIYNHDLYLGMYAHKLLSKLPKIKLYSNPSSSIILFNVDGYEALDVMNYLDKKNIFIRAGNHCSKLTGDLFGLSTCRASIGIYNTEEDITKLYKALKDMEEDILCLTNDVQDQKTAELENAEQINVR